MPGELDKPAEGAMWRGDLLKVLVSAREVEQAAVGKVLGFELLPQVVQQEKESTSSAATSQPSVKVASPRLPSESRQDEPLAAVPLLRVPHVTVYPITVYPGQPEARESERSLSLAELEGQQSRTAAPATPLLASWAYLEPQLSSALSYLRPGVRLDTERLVEHLARSDSFERPPRLAKRAWPKRIRVLVDRSRRLLPFFRDQDFVCARLTKMLGSNAVDVIFSRGIAAPGLCGVDGGRLLAQLTFDVPLLALTDLGVYGTSRDRNDWLQIGRQLRRIRQPIAALCPVPIRLFPRRAKSIWNALPWELGSDAEPDTVDVLLRRLAFANRVEPGFLRIARRQLGGLGDVGMEAVIWNHADLRGGHPAGFEYTAEQRGFWQRKLREELRSLREVSALQRVVDTARAFHQGVLPEEIWHEEALVLGGLIHGAGATALTFELQADIDAALAFFRRLPSTMGNDDLGAERLELGGWIQRVWARVPKETRAHVDVQPVLSRAYVAALEYDRQVRTGQLEPNTPPASSAAERAFGLVQQGGSIDVVADEARQPNASPIASFAASGLSAVVRTDSAAKSYSLDSRRQRVADVTTSSIELLTDRAELRVESDFRPEWAVAWGRHRKGLWADKSVAGLRYRYRWLPGYRGVEFGEEDAGGWVDEGFWRLPYWVVDHGKDEFGLWIAFEVGGVQQRMRYIPPGTFMMGSPESDKEAYGDEKPQHEVTLSRGYFMADTQCTQALWGAVMGDNPSDFKGDARPVEQVSWDDCQRFVATLNTRLPGLYARLPMEAEWEYACRAGTTTPRYGELDEVAWHTGNSGDKTRPVAQKQPNTWGLHDMLGNVFEWCSDYWGDYTADPVTDPSGPEAGANRVVRGGSWVVHAGGCRAACRDGAGPVIRHDDLGLRLARGPQAGPAEPVIQGQAEPGKVFVPRDEGPGVRTAEPDVGLPPTEPEDTQAGDPPESESLWRRIFRRNKKDEG